jgi:hypothetical protein
MHAAGPSTFRNIIMAAVGDGDWRVSLPDAANGTWINVFNPSSPRPPEQGWKLHVSATSVSATDVLHAILPALFGEGVTFKIAQSPTVLDALNHGNGGLSQVGKFVTVYPNDDEQAVRLAKRLDEATRGLRGPAVPSDRSLRPGSLVHYRYGGFGQRYLQTPMGQVLPALEAPDGRLVPDRRLPTYLAPDWADDPFAAAAITTAPQPANPRIGDRYLRLTTLFRAPRGAVHLAIDLKSQRRCVLKQANRDAAIASDGSDACERLRREAAVLAMLAPDPRFPCVYELFEHEDALYLAMQDVEGVTFESYLTRFVASGRLPTDERVAAWGRELARLFQAVHDRGLVYRDVKSPNVIVTPEGQFRLIDFEMAYGPPIEGKPFGYGTIGYMSPQQLAGAPPSITDDIYGVGALLYMAATGAEPSLGPDRQNLLVRPIRLLNPACGRRLESVIRRCLDPEPGRRFASMRELEHALQDAERAPSAGVPVFGGESARVSEVSARSRSRTLAHGIGDTLCATAVELGNGRGVTWHSRHRSLAGAPSRDLNAGSSGPVLVLAELVSRLDDPEHRRCLAEGARGLLHTPRPSGDLPAGLYVGDAGVGTALLRAGQVLQDASLVNAAIECGSGIARLPYRSPDLFNGTAGRARFHLWLWDATGDAHQLQHALAAGEALLASAEDAGAGALCWRIPPGYDGLSGSAYVGYAHGAAGIADTLLDVWEATGDSRLLDAARGAATWLQRLALPVLRDDSGLDWPSIDGAPPSGGLWCHGAAGVGRFFVHAARLDKVHHRSAENAARAARTTARGGRWSPPVQCHGLAGNIELLLDAYQLFGEPVYLREARSLARLLEAFGSQHDGRLVWPSENAFTFSPDYMVGYAGVAACLLRLADPENVPHVLSRETFKHAVTCKP